jgi:hypothetical protein
MPENEITFEDSDHVSDSESEYESESEDCFDKEEIQGDLPEYLKKGNKKKVLLKFLFAGNFPFPSFVSKGENFYNSYISILLIR